jgi:predicted homoserine dehydrogenase-like protein
MTSKKHSQGRRIGPTAAIGPASSIELRQHLEPGRRIGVVGTGFVARHFVTELLRRPDWSLGRVLTRRPHDTVEGIPDTALTDSVDALIESADIILECTGDIGHATAVAGEVLAAGRPLVTLNPEFHVTTGSAFVGRGLLTEAEGDQPGSLARLAEDAVTMGFEPLVYGNMKGFLNRLPTPEDMRYWATRQGLSLPMVTSFTDGTKLQIEQCLIGNFRRADISAEDLLGPAVDDLDEAALILGAAAMRAGGPITDYALSAKLPHGVFIVARHDTAQAAALRYLKLGEGPFYTLVQPNILVHLEAFKTLERIAVGQGALLHNTDRPHLSVAAVAKRRLLPGERIERGCGSFELRGICVRITDRPDHLPIGLANDLYIRRTIEPGQVLGVADVDLEASTALEHWQRIAAHSLVPGRERRAFGG